MNTSHNSRLVQQTHFIGVLVPDTLTAILQQCRDWMNTKYGCRSGYGTPIHITLVPPFHLGERFSDDAVCAAVKNAAQVWLQSGKKLTCCVDGFGTFSGRTVFAYVKPSAEWEMLRDIVFNELIKKCPGTVRKDVRPFQPHLTVANRDIPDGAAASALEHFAELSLNDSFRTDNITAFVRNNGKWLIESSVSI
jgi:2'-5' RNA ligase